MTATFFVFIICNDTAVQVNIHYNAIIDIPKMENAIMQWIKNIKPASKDEIESFETKKLSYALKGFAGKNGKHIKRLLSAKKLF